MNPGFKRQRYRSLEEDAAASTTEAMDSYGKLILGVIWKILPDADEASDLFQETFLQFHARIRQGERIEYPKAWLCRVAMNASFKRQRQRRRELSLEEDAAGDGSGEDEKMEQVLLVKKVRQLAAELPGRQREVFALRHFEEWSFAQIAAHLNCSEETARAHAYKGLRKIRAWLTGGRGSSGE
jgi:RNA polymerase sigma-70 factor, ECF subfamily